MKQLTLRLALLLAMLNGIALVVDNQELPSSNHHAELNRVIMNATNNTNK